jgi:lactoylglutathione lyase
MNAKASVTPNSVVLPNVKEAIPFFHVTDIDVSLRFYVDGLGFRLTNQWLPEGRIRWCMLQHGSASIMLQEYWRNGKRGGAPDGALGLGLSISFLCVDAVALYKAFVARGIAATRPFVGNRMWVTTVVDPDGYRMEFESDTDVAEETVYDG